MAGDIKSKFGTSNQALTITVTSLANNGVRGSTNVDNSSNLFQDVILSGQVKSGAASTSSTGQVNIYAYGTANGGSTYQEGFAGTDGAVTLTVPPNARLIAIINVVANATTYVLPPTAVSLAFGGVLPERWGIFVENKTGATLDASVGNFWYQGILSQYT